MYKFNSHVVYPSRNKRRVNSIRTTRERTSKSSIPKYIFARDTNSPQPLKDMNRLSKPNQPIDINGDAKVTHNVMHPDRTRILIHPNPLDGYAWTSKTYEVYIRTGKTNTCSADELLDCLTDWASTHQLVGVIGSLIKGEFEITDYTIAANVCREVSCLFSFDDCLRPSLFIRLKLYVRYYYTNRWVYLSRMIRMYDYH